MKIAFPIKENRGLASFMNDHFGSAGEFMVVDLESKDVQFLENQKLSDENASCKPGVFGQEAQVDAVVTHCIGDGAQRNLTAANIRVYAAQKETVAENLELMEKGELKLFHIFDFCQGKKNKKEGGCGHHH